MGKVILYGNGLIAEEYCRYLEGQGKGAEIAAFAVTCPELTVIVNAICYASLPPPYVVWQRYPVSLISSHYNGSISDVDTSESVAGEVERRMQKYECIN